MTGVTEVKGGKNFKQEEVSVTGDKWHKRSTRIRTHF